MLTWFSKIRYRYISVYENNGLLLKQNKRWACIEKKMKYAQTDGWF